jgi:hypothetical protein
MKQKLTSYAGYGKQDPDRVPGENVLNILKLVHLCAWRSLIYVHKVQVTYNIKILRIVFTTDNWHFFAKYLFVLKQESAWFEI